MWNSTIRTEPTATLETHLTASYNRMAYMYNYIYIAYTHAQPVKNEIIFGETNASACRGSTRYKADSMLRNEYTILLNAYGIKELIISRYVRVRHLARKEELAVE